MIKVLVTGSNGQLGRELQLLARVHPEILFSFRDIDMLNLTDPEAVKDFFSGNEFDFCINCAAYTAVDKAETEKDNAFKVNAEAAGYLAEACRSNNTILIHISTDFVFDGNSSKPYREDDHVNPLSVYGASKLLGEKNVLSKYSHVVLIRTSWLYSSFGNNFLKTMMRLGIERDEIGVVYDQTGTPTYAHDLAEVILKIMAVDKKNIPFGIYHYSNEGVCSWFDFATEIMKTAGLDCKVKAIETKDYPTPAKRPAYSVLNKRKIKETFALEIPHWKESLKKCVELLQI